MHAILESQPLVEEVRLNLISVVPKAKMVLWKVIYKKWLQQRRIGLQDSKS